MAVLPPNSFATSSKGRRGHAAHLETLGLSPKEIGESIRNLAIATGPDPRIPDDSKPLGVEAADNNTQHLRFDPKDGLRIARAAAKAREAGDPAIYENAAPPKPLG